MPLDPTQPSQSNTAPPRTAWAQESFAPSQPGRPNYEEFLAKMKERAQAQFGVTPLVEVLFPREPYIAARLVIVPGAELEAQKYVLLQTFGGPQLTTLEIVSFPGCSHDQIRKLYSQNFLELRTAAHFATGGSLGIAENSVIIFDASNSFGVTMAGFDSNSIVASALKLSLSFAAAKIRVLPHSQKALQTPATDAGRFFDTWPELYRNCLEQGAGNGAQLFLERALKIHREATSTPAELKQQVEQTLRSLASTALRSDYPPSVE